MLRDIRHKGLVMAVCAAIASEPGIMAAAEPGNLLSLGCPWNAEVGFGKVVYGALPPQDAGEVKGLDFRISGWAAAGDEMIAYGVKHADGRPQVWCARTRDGLVFNGAEMLYEVPRAKRQWLAGGVALRGSTLYLLQAQLGDPPTKGHPFHLFSGSLQGGDWRKLNDAPLYLGQDAFTLAWDPQLGRFVNYQTTYQAWEKRFADNMPAVRRVMHIRTSPDGLEWTPGGSFGVDGPHLPREQLIEPDELDTPDTEFYHFAVMDLGEFRAGILVKYVSQPSLLPKSGPFPHGPLLGYEWWIGKDGLKWQRPFRETSALEETRHPFAYFLFQPLVVGHELRWPMSSGAYALDRRRMFYVYSQANAELTTREFVLSGQPIVAEVSFESVRRHADQFIRQGYLMAELLDAENRIVPGFERDKCVFSHGPETRLALKWGERVLPEPAAGTFRLRLLFRDVRLFSISH